MEGKLQLSYGSFRQTMLIEPKEPMNVIDPGKNKIKTVRQSIV